MIPHSVSRKLCVGPQDVTPKGQRLTPLLGHSVATGRRGPRGTILSLRVIGVGVGVYGGTPMSVRKGNEI